MKNWLVGLLMGPLIKAVLDWFKEQYDQYKAKADKQKEYRNAETIKAAKDTQKLKDVKEETPPEKVDEAIDDALDHF